MNDYENILPEFEKVALDSFYENLNEGNLTACRRILADLRDHSPNHKDLAYLDALLVYRKNV